MYDGAHFSACLRGRSSPHFCAQGFLHVPFCPRLVGLSSLRGGDFGRAGSNHGATTNCRHTTHFPGRHCRSRAGQLAGSGAGESGLKPNARYQLRFHDHSSPDRMVSAGSLITKGLRVPAFAPQQLRNHSAGGNLHPPRGRALEFERDPKLHLARGVSGWSHRSGP